MNCSPSRSHWSSRMRTARVLPWQSGPLTFTKKAEGDAAWTVTSTSGPLTLKLTAQLDFDGTIEYQAALSSTTNVNLADVRLEIPMDNEAVRYFMGMNLKGGTPPGELRLEVGGDPQPGRRLARRRERRHPVHPQGRPVYVRPLNTNFYQQKPLVMPASWANRGRGGCGFARRRAPYIGQPASAAPAPCWPARRCTTTSGS